MYFKDLVANVSAIDTVEGSVDYMLKSIIYQIHCYCDKEECFEIEKYITDLNQYRQALSTAAAENLDPMKSPWQ
jgi:hypothetical protein